MSAIFGIIDFEERPIDPAWIKSMQDDLIHRGPDGQGLYCETSVVMGHMLLKVTPESEFEKSHYEENGLVIVANARLDEREELMDELQITGSDRDKITDPLLLLRSYQKRGKDFVKDIYGDFAFAIWDTNKKELFCARDQVGVKPFLYHFRDNRFVFSTELKSVVRLPFVETSIDNHYMRARALTISDEPQKTCWKNIHRLPAAHTLSTNGGHIDTYQFWKPIYQRNKRFKTEEDSAEAVRLLLEKIIADQTRVRGVVGVPLSGGLDSSTIACIAARQLNTKGEHLITVSSIYTPGEADVTIPDEMEYINEVLTQEKNIVPTFVHHSDHSFTRDLYDKYQNTYCPVNGFHYVDAALYQKLRLNNARRVLSGYLGDQTLTNTSINPFTILFTSGRLSTLKRLLSQYNKNNNQPIAAFIKHCVLTEFTPRKFQKAWNRFKHRADESINFSALPLIFSIKEQKLFEDKIDQSFHIPNRSPTDITAHIWPIEYYAHDEEMDADAAQCQVEITYPFSDRRLIELLLQIPVEHFYAGGKKRGLIRGAMKGILPEKIRNRTTKGKYSPGYPNLIKNDIPQMIQLVQGESLSKELKSFIDLGKLKIQLKNLSESEIEDSFTFFNWTLVEILMWVYFCKTLENE